MTFYLILTQLVLLILKLQGTVSWPWLTILIPMQIHGSVIILRTIASLIVFIIHKARRSMMTEEERAMDDLSQSLRKLSAKLK